MEDSKKEISREESLRSFLEGMPDLFLETPARPDEERFDPYGNYRWPDEPKITKPISLTVHSTPVWDIRSGDLGYGNLQEEFQKEREKAQGEGQK